MHLFEVLHLEILQIRLAKRSFCINHFSILLQGLVKVNKISSQSAERAKAQCSSFFDVVDSNVTAFKNFNKENDIGRDKSYADMYVGSL